MRKAVCIFFFATLLISCGVKRKIKSKKQTGALLKNISLIADKISETQIQDSTLSFVSFLKYSNNGKSLPKISLQTRIKNNRLIWMNGSLIFPIARMLITSEGAKGYTKFPEKLYFDSDYTFLEDKLQLQDLKFDQIQALFTGRPLFKMDLTDYKFEIIPEGYRFSYKKNKKLIQDQSSEDVTRVIVFSHNFSVLTEEFTHPETKTRVKIFYSNFKQLNGQYFPQNMKIIVSGKQDIEVDMEHRTISLNQALRTPFRIPQGYKKISF